MTENMNFFAVSEVDMSAPKQGEKRNVRFGAGYCGIARGNTSAGNNGRHLMTWFKDHFTARTQYFADGEKSNI